MRIDKDIQRRVKQIQSSEVTKRVKEIQDSMVESLKSQFDHSDLGHLRAVIRLTIEFQDYLEHGSVEMAKSIQQQPATELSTREFVMEVQSACEDPFNRFDLSYRCESIFSGVESFCALASAYRKMNGAAGSTLTWGATSAQDEFKTQFGLTFDNFIKEPDAEKKCRLLLDLFKLQIVFVGICYDE